MMVVTSKRSDNEVTESGGVKVWLWSQRTAVGVNAGVKVVIGVKERCQKSKLRCRESRSVARKKKYGAGRHGALAKIENTVQGVTERCQK
jgi:hypothetical protein